MGDIPPLDVTSRGVASSFETINLISWLYGLQDVPRTEVGKVCYASRLASQAGTNGCLHRNSACEATYVHINLDGLTQGRPLCCFTNPSEKGCGWVGFIPKGAWPYML